MKSPSGLTHSWPESDLLSGQGVASSPLISTCRLHTFSPSLLRRLLSPPSIQNKSRPVSPSYSHLEISVFILFFPTSLTHQIDRICSLGRWMRSSQVLQYDPIVLRPDEVVLLRLYLAVQEPEYRLVLAGVSRQ